MTTTKVPATKYIGKIIRCDHCESEGKIESLEEINFFRMIGRSHPTVQCPICKCTIDLCGSNFVPEDWSL